jgi:hypothetical protein
MACLCPFRLLNMAAVWAWTDIEIKKMQVSISFVAHPFAFSWRPQPYVDLAYGNAPPHKTLLLDYTRTK